MRLDDDHSGGGRDRAALVPAAVRTAFPLLLSLLFLPPLLVTAVMATPATADGGRGGNVDRDRERDRAWPVGGAAGARRPVVMRGWEPPASPYGPGHRGVDLAAWPGGPVRAAGPGRVSFAGQVAGRRVLAIELDGTGAPPLRITYEPVRASVEKGERVAAGQRVGTLNKGPFHCASGCLHWGLRRAERYLDPLSLLPGWMLRGGPSRLLPVFGVPEPAAVRAGAAGPAAAAARRSAVAASSDRSVAGTAMACTGVLTAAAWWAHRRLCAGHRVGHRRCGPTPGISPGRRAAPSPLRRR